jgi:hypothetical protein
MKGRIVDKITNLPKVSCEGLDIDRSDYELDARSKATKGSASVSTSQMEHALRKNGGHLDQSALFPVEHAKARNLRRFVGVFAKQGVEHGWIN